MGVITLTQQNVTRANAPELSTRMEDYIDVLTWWSSRDGHTSDGGEGERGEGHRLELVTARVSGSLRGGYDAYSVRISDLREGAVA